jgi:hypothetical protein
MPVPVSERDVVPDGANFIGDVVPDNANFIGDNLYTWVGERVWRKNPITGFEKVYKLSRRYTDKRTLRESISVIPPSSTC